jgi:hypothetical protein
MMSSAISRVTYSESRVYFAFHSELSPFFYNDADPAVLIVPEGVVMIFSSVLIRCL